MDEKNKILHKGPKNCTREWLRYVTQGRNFLRSVWSLLRNSRREEPKVFCLNSGGCGSKYLIHLLEANGVSRCYHEKAPDLDRTGVQYFLTGEYESTIKKILRLTRNQVYFESSNRLFSLAPLLKEVFPNSRFIHLHRDGVDSVRSVVNKTLWPDIMECSTRLRYESRLAGDSGLSPFERTCHYWANINERIYDDLSSIEKQSVESITFESLISGEIDKIESILGRSLSVRTIDPVNTKNELKDESANLLGSFEEWPEKYKHLFYKICGPTQRKIRHKAIE